MAGKPLTVWLAEYGIKWDPILKATRLIPDHTSNELTKNTVNMYRILLDQGFTQTEQITACSIMSLPPEDPEFWLRRSSNSGLENFCGISARSIRRMHESAIFRQLLKPDIRYRRDHRNRGDNAIVTYDITPLIELVRANHGVTEAPPPDDGGEPPATIPRTARTPPIAEPPIHNDRQDVRPFIATPLSYRDFNDKRLIAGAAKAVEWFRYVSRWFFPNGQTGEPWYDVLKPELFAQQEYAYKAIRDELWNKLIDMQDKIDSDPNARALPLEQMIMIVSWFTERSTINNVEHAFGDEQTWANAITLWVELGRDACALDQLQYYLTSIYDLCCDLNYYRPTQNIIHLGQKYEQERVKIGDPTVIWLKELFDWGRDVETRGFAEALKIDVAKVPTGFLAADDLWFRAWCQSKIKFMKSKGWHHLSAATNMTHTQEPPFNELDQVLINMFADQLNSKTGSDTTKADKFAEIKHFLGLDPKCIITWIPRGWALAPEHKSAGDTSKIVTRIDGCDYFVGSNRYTATFHHQCEGKMAVIRVTPANFYKYKDSWHDVELRNKPPSLKDMLEDGFLKEEVNPSTGQWWRADTLTPVRWSAE